MSNQPKESTAGAMRAARAYFHGIDGCQTAIVPMAHLIDRETGLPELIAALRASQEMLARLVRSDPKENITIAWAQCLQVEAMARAALDAASGMTPAEQEQQRRSLAYGNAIFDNPNVTRQGVDDAADAEGQAK